MKLETLLVFASFCFCLTSAKAVDEVRFTIRKFKFFVIFEQCGALVHAPQNTLILNELFI